MARAAARPGATNFTCARMGARPRHVPGPSEPLCCTVSTVASAPVMKMRHVRVIDVEPSLERDALSMPSKAGQLGVVCARGGAVHCALELADLRAKPH